ncbi:methyltransferase, TIGR04325 family [Leptospira sp. GIMC2001]|nr:methyltransferase, TIGR04325 family [Leptospira sp. GIMC2001]WCL51262.1 methyltransferase, TIGR04325 family [Leptospira sp. GIMC2001]
MNTKNLAPIALFAYARLDHLQKTIESLKLNRLAQDTELYIYSDNAKNSNIEPKIIEVRKYIRSITGFKNITIIERTTNFGLANSIIDGVTEVTNKHGQVIVLEDDMITSPFFLDYMNEGLNLYKDDQEVCSIHGYIYPTSIKLPKSFFLKGADCWGWATWSRGWKIFEHDGSKLLAELESKNLTGEFDFNDSYPYTQMLRDQIHGKNDSWAIRWYASAFLKNKKTLYPGESFVTNIGNDGSGTHCGVGDEYLTIVKQNYESLDKIKIIEDKKSKEIIEQYFQKNNGSLNINDNQRNNVYAKSKNLIKKILPYSVLNEGKKIENKLKAIILSIKIKAKAIIFGKNKIQEERYWGFFGNYPDWDSALSDTDGYDQDNILEKCKTALLKVKNGEAVSERDSVILEKKEYSWPLVAALVKICIEYSSLRVLDFGGSLGSSYFLYRNFFGNLLKSWSIIEQENFVKCGNSYFKDSKLEFFSSIEESLKIHKPNVIILSSVLPYIKDPYGLINTILDFKIPYIIVDRTYFLKDKPDRITKQVVPDWIYSASYPAWFFNQDNFIREFKKQYTMTEDFDSYLNAAETLEPGTKAYERGMIFKLK